MVGLVLVMRNPPQGLTEGEAVEGRMLVTRPDVAAQTRFGDCSSAQPCLPNENR